MRVDTEIRSFSLWFHDCFHLILISQSALCAYLFMCCRLFLLACLFTSTSAVLAAFLPLARFLMFEFVISLGFILPYCAFYEDFYNSINTVFFICVWKIRFNSKNKCCKFILWNYMVGVNGYIKIGNILMCKIFAWILYVQWVKSIFLRNTQKQNLALLCNDTWWSWLKSLIPTNAVPHL